MSPRQENQVAASSGDNEPTIHTPVLIVGAGPTGLLLSSELQRRSVSTHLIDSNPAPLEWDRATVINTATLEVMDSIGLVNHFLDEGTKIRGVKMHSDGVVIGTFRFEESGSKFGHALGLSEERTEHFLTDYLEEHGGKIHWSSKLVGLEKLNKEEGGGGVLATVERSTVDEKGEATETSRYRVRADYVVGCDGMRSKTREWAGIDFEGHTIPQPWAVFDVTLDGWEGRAGHTYEANYVYLDALTPVIMTPLPDKKWRIYLRPTSDESDLAEEASTVLHRYEPDVNMVNAQNYARFRCVSKVASTYRSGPILLAGDAAHACTPAEGHGMNYGLQDSFNLAWKLALVCSGRANVSLLDSYEAERRPFAQMIIASGTNSERVTTMTCPNQRAARDKGLRDVFASVMGTRKKASVMAKTELNVEYGSSAIVCGDGGRGDDHDDGEGGMLAPGGRFPNVHAVKLGPDDGWKACSLHELTYRPGHTVLLLGGPDADGPSLVELHGEIRDVVASEAKKRGGDEDGSDQENVPSMLLEAAFTFSVDPSLTAMNGKIGLLETSAVPALGVRGITLLVVRPDGFVGMRSDGGEGGDGHVKVLEKYRQNILQ